MTVRNGYVTRLTPLSWAANVGFLYRAVEDFEMTSKKREQRSEPALPFDVTQEIDPALVADLHRGNEPTLTQTDFEEITLVLPENRKPK